MTRLRARTCLLAMLFFTLGSCVEPFAPSTQLTKTQVLAIRSTPVELAPDSGVTLEALVFVPGEGGVESQWTWCPSLGGAATNYECALSAGALARQLEPDGGLTLDESLGSGSTVSFSYPVDSRRLSELCQAGRSGTGSGADAGEDAGVGAGSDGSDGGAEDGGTARLQCGQTLDVAVLLTVDAGTSALRAFRPLSVMLSATTALSANPTVTGLTFSVADGGPTLAEDAALLSGATYQLTLALPSSASERYSAAVLFGGPGSFAGEDAGASDAGAPDAGGPGGRGDGGIRPPVDAGTPGADDAGSTDPRRDVTLFEALSVAWYSTEGTFGAATTVLPPAILGLDGGLDLSDSRDWSPLESNTWVAPTMGNSATVRFIAVVRDSRGGVTWLSLTRPLSGGDR